MKKTVLAVLLAVLITTPCFGQEIETDGLFSIDGTLWEYDVDLEPGEWAYHIGFEGGKVYRVGVFEEPQMVECRSYPLNDNFTITFYLNLGLFSVAYNLSLKDQWYWLMLPYKSIGWQLRFYETPPGRNFKTLTKINDNWSTEECTDIYHGLFLKEFN